LLDVVERVVINTGPVIALGRADAFAVIEKLPIRFITPAAVAAEIAAGAVADHPVLLPDWIEVVTLTTPVPPLVCQMLDPGEAAVIQLAVEQGIMDVCIDEWRGRRAAKTVGLRLTGSLGLLGRAKHCGLIPEVRPWIDRLIAGGTYYNIELLRRFLQAMGEPPINDKDR
jgi:predicted nucleic acid-binding protein